MERSWGLVAAFLAIVRLGGAEAGVQEPPVPAPAPAMLSATAIPRPEGEAQGLTGRQALDRLLAGNLRFRADATLRAHHGPERRLALAVQQHPLAVVVCCADARVPPEEVFDQGLGDLFVVRTSGPVVDDIALGSIEYACEQLHAPLVLVLGHDRCEAVAAACGLATPVGRMRTVVEALRANLAATRSVDGGTVAAAVLANARMVARQIAGCTPIIEGLVRSEEVLVAAACYHLDTGEVAILP